LEGKKADSSQNVEKALPFYPEIKVFTVLNGGMLDEA